MTVLANVTQISVQSWLEWMDQGLIMIPSAAERHSSMVRQPPERKENQRSANQGAVGLSPDSCRLAPDMSQRGLASPHSITTEHGQNNDTSDQKFVEKMKLAFPPDSRYCKLPASMQNSTNTLDSIVIDPYDTQSMQQALGGPDGQSSDKIVTSLRPLKGLPAYEKQNRKPPGFAVDDGYRHSLSRESNLVMDSPQYRDYPVQRDARYFHVEGGVDGGAQMEYWSEKNDRKGRNCQSGNEGRSRPRYDNSGECRYSSDQLDDGRYYRTGRDCQPYRDSSRAGSHRSRRAPGDEDRYHRRPTNASCHGNGPYRSPSLSGDEDYDRCRRGCGRDADGSWGPSRAGHRRNDGRGDRDGSGHRRRDDTCHGGGHRRRHGGHRDDESPREGSQRRSRREYEGRRGRWPSHSTSHRRSYFSSSSSDSNSDSSSDSSPHRRRDRRDRGRSPQLPKLKYYSGDQDWNTYKFQFERMAKRHDWSKRKMAERLVDCLEGKALNFVKELNLESYHQLTKNLDRRFGAKQGPAAARSELDTIKQYVDETVEDFSQRVHFIVLEGHPAATQQTIDVLAVEAFHRGCRDKKAAETSMNKKPRNIYKALKYVKEALSTQRMLYGVRGRQASARKVCFSQSDEEYEVRSASDGDRRNPRDAGNVQKQIDTLNTQYTNLSSNITEMKSLLTQALRKEGSTPSRPQTPVETGATPPKSQRPFRRNWTPSRSPTPPRRQTVCYNCHQLGHFAKDCPEKVGSGQPSEGGSDSTKKDLNSRGLGKVASA